MDIQIERELHIQAPPGIAPHVDIAYGRAEGPHLAERVREAALFLKPSGERHYYARRLYIRTSDDGGRTWVTTEELGPFEPSDADALQQMGMWLILDAAHDVLIDLYMTFEVDLSEGMFAIDTRQQKTQRTYYRLSKDGGHTWTPPRQVVDARPEYDDTHWAPGVTYGVEGARPAGQPVFLDDGTLVIGFDVLHPEKPPGAPPGGSYYMTTMYAQARLSAAGDALDWRFGAPISVPFPQSTMGCCEAALTQGSGGRLFNTMRCQGSREHDTYAIRYTTISADGGMTWSAPEPLRYEDGGTVWTPAAVHRFYSSARTGGTYLLANILDGPVYDQQPRYPLTIAEFDTEQLCVRRDTVRAIQDLPEGAPRERRYTNFTLYEERGSGDLILVMPEQPRSVDFSRMTKPEEFTADCVAWRVRLLE